MNTDLIIIGSGPGGYRAAAYAAQNGLQVVIVEKAHAGGTCLNSGCIPTKTLCHHAEQLSHSSSVNKDEAFASAMAHKAEVIGQLRDGVGQLMSSPGITFVKGEARFVEDKVVEVLCRNDDGSESCVQYTAPNIIIATGSVAKLPPIEGIDMPHVMTSTELLDIERVPSRLCVIGAGVIGLEMASVFNAFGSKVTVVEFLKECLLAMDSDLAKRLRKSMEKNGIEFFMQSGVKRITETEVIFADKKGREQSVEADAVLVATGRAANITAVPESLTVSKFIPVDDDFQTSIPGIYAIGDVNGRCLLAHAATFQGLHVVNHILGKSDSIRFDIMPAAVFTAPEVASVGPTEQQLKDQGSDFRVLKGYYRSNGRALANECTEGLLKLVVAPDDRILACHAMGCHAADIVQEATVLISLGATVAQLRDIIHIHPTLAEVLHEVSFI
ncbi:MAG: dihydrolipoyl dehydrogenase [Bacteroidaceae bacterium]|nr:dihydrolipoyl dehydrogenase [Bacteroidaceae bacterium]